MHLKPTFLKYKGCMYSWPLCVPIRSEKQSVCMWHSYYFWPNPLWGLQASIIMKRFPLNLSTVRLHMVVASSRKGFSINLYFGNNVLTGWCWAFLTQPLLFTHRNVMLRLLWGHFHCTRNQSCKSDHWRASQSYITGTFISLKCTGVSK